MAAITSNKLVKTHQYISTPDGVVLDYWVAASTAIYKGSLVALNASGNLVSYAPATVGTSIVGNHRLMGIALSSVSAQSAANLVMCPVLVKGRITIAIGSTTIADIGKPVFASTNNPADITKASAGNAYCGYIASFGATGGDDCVIEFDPQMHGGGIPVTCWASPIIASASANLVTIVPKSANPNGLIIYDAYGIVTTDYGAAAVYTLQDTAATTLLTTFTMGTTSDAGEIVKAAVNSVQITATDAAVTLVPAGLGVDILVTTTTANGAGKFFVHTHPVT